MTNLDIWQGHEVLGDVNNKLVHESRSNVESIHGVVQVVSKRNSSIIVYHPSQVLFNLYDQSRNTHFSNLHEFKLH